MTIFKVVGRGASHEKKILADLEVWEKHAGPKRAGQWQNQFSAKEAARAWLDALPHLPPEITALLATHRAFGTVASWSAEPEVQLRFDAYGGPRNTDLLAQCTDNYGRFHLAVEAKGRESFGETVARALITAQRRLKRIPESKGEARINELCELYLDAKPLDDDVQHLRYQLLTATAGAVQEALRAGISRTVLLVHEFVRAPATHAAYAANAKDLERFVTRLSRGSVGKVPPERLTEVLLPETVIRGRSLRFFVGKVSRPIPPISLGDLDGATAQ